MPLLSVYLEPDIAENKMMVNNVQQELAFTSLHTVTASVGQGFGDPRRVTGKGVHGWGWGLQSWNPRTLQLPASTPVAVICTV